VLEYKNDSAQFQYWERRGNLILSIDKSVFFIHGRKDFQAGVYGGLKGVYTYGSYRGSGIKPDDRILAALGAGLCLEGRFYRVSAGYEYLELDLAKISPHRFNVSVGFFWNRNRNNFKPDFLNW
jgi:hypothetical protein